MSLSPLSPGHDAQPASPTRHPSGHFVTPQAGQGTEPWARKAGRPPPGGRRRVLSANRGMEEGRSQTAGVSPRLPKSPPTPSSPVGLRSHPVPTEPSSRTGPRAGGPALAGTRLRGLVKAACKEDFNAAGFCPATRACFRQGYGMAALPAGQGQSGLHQRCSSIPSLPALKGKPPEVFPQEELLEFDCVLKKYSFRGVVPHRRHNFTCSVEEGFTPERALGPGGQVQGEPPASPGSPGLSSRQKHLR